MSASTQVGHSLLWEHPMTMFSTHSRNQPAGAVATATCTSIGSSGACHGLCLSALLPGLTPISCCHHCTPIWPDTAHAVSTCSLPVGDDNALAREDQALQLTTTSCMAHMHAQMHVGQHETTTHHCMVRGSAAGSMLLPCAAISCWSSCSRCIRQPGSGRISRHL